MPCACTLWPKQQLLESLGSGQDPSFGLWQSQPAPTSASTVGVLMTPSGRHLRGLTHWEVTIDVISPRGLRNLPYCWRGHNITATYLGGAFGLQRTFTHLCNCPGGPGKAPGQAQLSEELFAWPRSHCQQSRQSCREASYHTGTGEAGRVGWGSSVRRPSLKT